MESKELTTTTDSQLAALQEAGFDFAEDLKIGRLVVQQALSQPVQNGTAHVGDIVDISTSKIECTAKESLEFIVIRPFKYWIEKQNDKFLARYAAKNSHEKVWQEGDITRMFHHSFYVILCKDMSEGAGLCFPVEMPFRSTDIGTAKKISSFCIKMLMAGRPIWGKTFKLTPVRKTKDNYTWWGTDVSEGREATKEEMDAALMWQKTLANTDAVVHTNEDDEVISDDAMNETPPPVPRGTNGEDSFDPGQF